MHHQKAVSLIFFLCIFLHITSGFVWKVAPNQLQHTKYCPSLSEVVVYGNLGEIRELASFQKLANGTYAFIGPRFGDYQLLMKCGTSSTLEGQIVAQACDRSFCSLQGECTIANEGTYSEIYECFCDSWYYGTNCEYGYPNGWWVTGLGWLLWIFLLVAILFAILVTYVNRKRRRLNITKVLLF